MIRKALLLLSGLVMWFGAAAQSDDFKITGGPYLQMLGEHEVTIVWATNRDAVSWVEIAPDNDEHFYATERPKFFQTDMGRKVVGTLHRVHVTGLEKGTTYRYRIYSKEVTAQTNYYVQYGKTAASNVYDVKPFYFTTFDNNKKSVSFTVVNDIHGNNEMLAALTDNVRKDKNDFVLFNGDMVTTFASGQQIFDGFLTTAVKGFASEIPFFYARGNHETRGLFFAHYRDYFPSSTGQTYYSFQAGPVFFIVLDGGEDKPDSDIEYNGLGGFDTYRAQEAEWLKETLDSDACKNAAYRVVVIHIPPGYSAWYGPIEAKRLFVPLLNDANIDLMLCGHLHKHLYVPAGENGCNFPVLINSNVEGAYIHAGEKEMEVTVKDKDHKVLHNWKYPRK